MDQGEWIMEEMEKYCKILPQDIWRRNKVNVKQITKEQKEQETRTQTKYGKFCKNNLHLMTYDLT